MINFRKITASLFLGIGALLLSSQAQAQFQVNVNGNYAASTAAGSSFSDGQWGGGATLRYYVKPNLAIGLNGRYFMKDYASSVNVYPTPGSAISIKASANLLMVTGQAEYFFSESALRPYIGVEAGLYRTAATLEISNGYNSEKASDNASNFGVAPKVGLQYALSPAIGINVDAGYHIVFDDGETGKLLLLGAGVFFTFGQR